MNIAEPAQDATQVPPSSLAALTAEAHAAAAAALAERSQRKASAIAAAGLRPYDEHQREGGPAPGGVACSELECDGAMQPLAAARPEQFVRGLATGRVLAACDACGWRGWA